MKWLDADQVRALSDFSGLVAALAEMNRRGTDRIERLLMSQPTTSGQNDCLILPAWTFDRCLGLKIANVFPGNAAKGLASVQGAYLLFDGRTGEALCGLDGPMLTLRKTAANSALASNWLARADAETLLMVGAGALAPHLVEAHCAVRPIRRVLWWNRTMSNVDKAIEAIAPFVPEVRLESTDSLAEAASAADIISTATMSQRPLIEGAWLKPGCHLDLVGGYRPDMREADDECARRSARHYVDARFMTVQIAGDVIDPIAAGIIDGGNVIDFGEVARGEKPKRLSDDEITWFKSGGGGHEDLATAWYIYGRA